LGKKKKKRGLSQNRKGLFKFRFKRKEKLDGLYHIKQFWGHGEKR